MNEQITKIDDAKMSLDDVTLLLVTLNTYLAEGTTAKTDAEKRNYLSDADQYRALCGVLIDKMRLVTDTLETTADELDKIQTAASSLLCKEAAQ
jgi:hypothetical protein